MKPSSPKMSITSHIAYDSFDSVPSQAMNMCGILIVTGKVGIDQFKKLIKERVACFSRFRSIPSIHQARKGQVSFHLRDICQDSYDISKHFTVKDFSSFSKEQDLYDYANQILQNPYEEGICQWEFHVLEAYQKSKTAIIARFNHGLGDGFTIIQLLLSLTDEKEVDHHCCATSAKSKAKAGEWVLLSLTNLVMWCWGLMTLILNLPMAFACVILSQYLEDSKTPLCPVGMKKGTRKLYFSKTIPLQTLKALGHKHGATINDVVLTLANGAARRYLESRKYEITPSLKLRTIFPFNCRTEKHEIGVVDEGTFGNKSVLFAVKLPIHTKEPVQRLKKIKKTMDSLKATPMSYLGYFKLITDNFALQHSQFTRDLARKLIVSENYNSYNKSLFVTNVRGPTCTRFLGGYKVESVKGALSAPNAICCLSYNDEMYFTFCFDSYHVPDGDYFVQLFEDEMSAMMIIEASNT